MLEVGTGVRYRTLGAGIVDKHVTRDFQGKKTRFAVIYFPHRDMTAQIPIGDPNVEDKIRPVVALKTLKKMLREMGDRAEVLPRAWDMRAQQGEAALKNGGPEEWVSLLGSYATAAGAGVDVAASDDDLVRQAEELIAAELCCASGEKYDWAIEQVSNAYKKITTAKSPTQQKAEHFAAVVLKA